MEFRPFVYLEQAETIKKAAKAINAFLLIMHTVRSAKRCCLQFLHHTIALSPFLPHTNIVMEDCTAYTNRIETALKSKTDNLDMEGLKKLKDDFKLFQLSFQSIFNVLLKKGLISEDPYKYEMKISEVETPSESPFAESEKNEKISIRLSQYESYLDFLNNYYQFSVEFLTLGRIKRLIALTKYFNFTEFSENSTHINTKYFAEIVQLVKKGSDSISIGIINEGLFQLDKTSRKIFQILKELTFVHKEQYKMELRTLIVNGMQLRNEQVYAHQEDIIKKIRQKFAELAGDRPFYPDLAAEILKEDYSSQGEKLRDDVIKRLEVAKDKEKDKTVVSNYKNILIDGSRIIIGVGLQLEDAVRKLMENQNILESMDTSFLAKVKRALKEMFGRKNEAIIHEVDYIDPVSATRKNESINFSEFCSDAGKKAQNLAAMVSRNSQAFKRLEASTEDNLFKFLAKSIEDFQAYHKKLAALEEFFMTSIRDPEFKGKVRSIKIETGSLKNAIIKANQKRYEYIAQKEEEEQMKRLGITGNS